MRVDVLETPVDIDGSRLEAAPGTVREQLDEYARGERRAFDLDVSYPDSFTGRVMAAMAAIPYGETRTYGDLAADLETAPVAVGSACGRNPVPVIVPCHRVVGADSLGGFSAGGDDPLGFKRRLLDHEERVLGGARTGTR
ncbi:methylated-DNA--[protein]-cysteine S-methyltransferase [Natrononativus amylolyticus]|uniref:methylated-DNA--[protein]-cysteine S-methyltransferase n=1 Tax=Natrononativus amylolyticus TaxID=2963434 RepID=UPI0020CE98A1|nr:methylated-DNA--[protein]-cysteine S-methyltransferase [Natrononativus amylolyticus]